ncbi:sn-glycerol 3-phosphate transport system ATP-binding protein/multiple sugar transport system ATP-binding protein [Actinokineospora alba]|uniref:sn-glycerol 3-phosphate transport system ATP-binding protein/multiple sugar transport system ATP-binding protein n=1 Tax=Actinokineospora alba TaxID=504798 RepID=A0A1H0FY13_9PSEU|nr:ABC transporter ATP-binding protein [Actinokineospora alba]TDP69676.1 sn-glycerol 3-phosphate transport system ATP-binding protein/multiple sugar transport system ATP-binding protein [Actinokineospora alba]SDI11431.1 sn-glycerol 3-phosphate transport system ATP-binding protein/multiple sugar transport system ATP-binding protein [Actinokineospora alba]SDN99535.1 sn-glycerol 3-phosphate transport system ATP-binding protein/multiple sugar transport system ATP-binding protein [Actinokineospora al
MSLRILGAHKVFHARGARVTALDGIDLEAKDGELLVIVGPSGSGKSTLLRAVAGLEPLDAGQVLIGDRDVTSVPPGRRDVAMVFQEAALFPHLSVAANIGIGERARGANRRAVEARVRSVAETLAVDHLLGRMPGELSGGERQRVALARVMIRTPAVCLLDEPLASVDAELRLRMRGEIRTVQRSLGVPMVHVTHDQVEAMAMGDRVAVMDAGRVLQCDTPAEVYARPATMAVARGFGPLPMNLLPIGEGTVMGLRPERVRVRPAEASGRAGSVVEVEPAGEECLVRVLPDDANTDLLARLPWTDAPTVGDRVTVAWRPEDEHHFDATTGERR